MAERISDAERLARIKRLGVSDKEAREILEYDKAVNRDSTCTLEYDLTPEQNKIAQSYCHAGIRNVKKKGPTAYKFDKRERKPNATKGGIIAELAEFLTGRSQFDIQNLVITNKERQIAFSIGEDSFELTLVQKRKKKTS